MKQVSSNVLLLDYVDTLPSIDVRSECSYSACAVIFLAAACRAHAPRTHTHTLACTWPGGLCSAASRCSLPVISVVFQRCMKALLSVAMPFSSTCCEWVWGGTKLSPKGSISRCFHLHTGIVRHTRVGDEEQGSCTWTRRHAVEPAHLDLWD